MAIMKEELLKGLPKEQIAKLKEPPETKYDEPFQVIGNISITNPMNQCLSKNLIDLISRSPH